MRGNKNGNSLYAKCQLFVGSIKFFYGVLALAILQGIWYILSFQAIIFDESRHFGFVSVYAHRLNPFFTQQPDSLAYLGDVVREPSYLFYYIMSWPLRFISLFTDNSTVQLTFLRLISLVIFVGGLFVFRKVFLKAGISSQVAHMVLLLIILVPALAPLAGALNYDNAVFLLSGLIFLVSLTLLKDRKASLKTWIILLIFGLLGSLIQFKMIALFVPIFFYLVYDLFNRFGLDVFKDFLKQIKPLLKSTTGILLVLSLIVLSGLFLERPVYNMARWHAITPSCTNFATVENCKKNYTEKRNIEARDAAKADNFHPVNPFVYVLAYWIPSMVSTSAALTPWAAFTSMNLMFYAGTLGGIVLILIYLRDFMKDKLYRFLLFAMGAYSALLAAYLYSSYVIYGIPVAISGRYLLSILPIFIGFTILGFIKLLKKYPYVQISIAALAMLIFATQGGGVTSAIIHAEDGTYWQYTVVIKTNHVINALFTRIY